MEVKLSIPDDLVEYIKYIPEDILPEIFTDIIRNDILSRLDKKSKSNTTGLDEVINLLQSQAFVPNVSKGSVTISQVTEEPKEIEKVEPGIHEIIDFTAGADDEDDDLDDFLSLVK